MTVNHEDLVFRLHKDVIIKLKALNASVEKVKVDPFDRTVLKGTLSKSPMYLRRVYCLFLRLSGIQYKELGVLFGVTEVRTRQIAIQGSRMLSQHEWTKEEMAYCRAGIKKNCAKVVHNLNPLFIKKTLSEIDHVRDIAKDVLAKRLQQEKETPRGEKK